MLYYASEISKNMHRREPEGYLICANVPIARSGTQDYYQDEIGQDGDEIVKVYRPEEEVFSKETISSFEGMPVTNDHPDDADGVTVDNIQYLGKGHAQNVHRGVGKESDLLIADLFIEDPQTIQEVLDGKREISCGYTYELCEENGRYVQRQIRGNHIAIVDRGRAGHRVCIKDSAPHNTERSKNKMAKNAKKNHRGIISRALSCFIASDAATEEELEAAVDAAEALASGELNPPAEPQPEAQDNDPEADPMEARLKALEDSIAELKKAKDEPAPAPAEEEDPLAKLEADLDAMEGKEPSEEDPVNPDEDPDEQESHFVDPEEINEQDEDETEEEEIPSEEESVDCKARDAMREAIKAMKPIIAQLPKAEQKKASDALAARLRKAYGMDAKVKPEKNGYTKLLKARKKAGDSQKADPTELGKSIMAARNPNYTK